MRIDGETIDQITGALALIALIMGVVVLKMYEAAPGVLLWLGALLLVVGVVACFEYDEETNQWRTRKC